MPERPGRLPPEGLARVERGWYNARMDSATNSALTAGDRLLAELRDAPSAQPPAATMGRLQKCSYSHKAMIDLIIEKPELTQNQIAAHFGYSASWISNILASDAFQAEMASRREEIVDPRLKATVEERFRALVILSLDVLYKKLEAPVVSDNVAIRAAELGAKALGLGGHAAPSSPALAADRLERIAQNLENLNRRAQERTIDGQVISQEPLPVPAG